MLSWATLKGVASLEKESLKLRTDFTKAAVSNGGLDLYKGFEPYIDEYSQIEKTTQEPEKRDSFEIHRGISLKEVNFFYLLSMNYR